MNIERMGILMRKTKIICTVGPASQDYEVLKKLALSGMDIMRLNFSHGNLEEHGARMDDLVKLRNELKKPIAILLDTKGPEIRTGMLASESGKVELTAGKEFVLTTEEILGNEAQVSVSYKDITKDVEKGTRILIDDGLIELVVKSVEEPKVICEIKNGGMLGNRKGVNIPNKDISLPALTEKDIIDIKFGIEKGVDFIAASFIRKASDVMAIRRVLEENKGNFIKIISKIECRSAVDNIDEILNVSDGIMVARGDLGVEIPTEEVPIVQKMIIRKCNHAGKPVVTATQMLDSMIRNPRPTRAEASDVANAIYDGTDAIMLSGETANGSYPIEAVSTMARIAEKTEDSIDYKKRMKEKIINQRVSVTNAISHATCTTAEDLGASAIIVVTKSGYTARMVAKYKSDCGVIALTMDERVVRQLNIVSNVYPGLLKAQCSTDEIFKSAVNTAMEDYFVEEGDIVVIAGGVPLGVSGTTNILKVEIAGNVILRGTPIGSGVLSKTVYVVKDIIKAEEEFEDGEILVIKSSEIKTMKNLLKRASAIISEEIGKTSPSAIIGETLDIPVIVDAGGATTVLKTGANVTIDMNKGYVYSGVVEIQ
jgi:pyruvate kinase